MLFRSGSPNLFSFVNSQAHFVSKRAVNTFSSFPELFDVGMEALTVTLKCAAEEGLLSPIGGCSPLQRLSIYADDVVLFTKPHVLDLLTVRELLQMFGEASGLRVNYRKSSATLIRGQPGDEARVLEIMQCPLVNFQSDTRAYN